MVRAISLFIILMIFWIMLSGQVNIWKEKKAAHGPVSAHHGEKGENPGHHEKERELNTGNLYLLGCGVFCCALVTYIAIRKKILDQEGLPLHLAFGMLLYFPWLLWQILLSNLDVAYRVWHPSRPISPRFLSVPFETKTDLGTVVYCNSITLTPGTVTVSVDNDNKELLIHALSDKAADGLLAGTMHEKVKKLEGSR